MKITEATANDWPDIDDLETNTAGDTGPAARLREQVFRTVGMEVDRANRIVRNVAIAGAVSRNGYRYTTEALADAVPLYEGRPVFLDHAADPQQPQSRSTRDLIGILAAARYVGSSDSSNDSGSIRADIRVLDTESGRTFLTLCESNEPGVGMSHVVLARRNADGSVVETIEKVISVDAVTFPATTTRLSEQSSEANGNLVSACKACEECEHRLREVEQERDQVRKDLEHVREVAATSHRLALLADSGLPNSAVTDVFREAVLHAVDDEAAQRLIRDRLLLVRDREHRPISEPRTTQASNAGFVAAVRGA